MCSALSSTTNQIEILQLSVVFAISAWTNTYSASELVDEASNDGSWRQVNSGKKTSNPWHGRPVEKDQLLDH